jgi:hypothetical protein
MRARVPAVLLLQVCLSIGPTFPAQAIDDNRLLTSVDALTRLVVPTAKGVPFSAQIRAEWDGPIPGAGQVVRSNTASLLRDSAGRVRQEHWTWARSNGSTQPPELLEITFMDPVKATGARCVTKERVCRVMPLDVAHSSSAPAALLPTGKLGGSSMDNVYNVHEDLGTSVMEGVTTIGYRDTQTFTARGDPNPADPRVVAHTHWLSLDLGFDLQMEVTSLEIGKLNVRITDLRREEPDAQEFAFPDGYAIDNELPVTTSSTNSQHRD